MAIKRIVWSHSGLLPTSFTHEPTGSLPAVTGAAMLIQATTNVHCPICANAPAGEILTKYKMMAITDRPKEVGGLRVFMCSVGHVFFVRRVDADLAEHEAASPQ